MIEQKVFRGKLWKAFGMEQNLVRYNMGTFYRQRKWTKELSAGAEKERQEGLQGNWQKESPFKEALELVKRSNDLSVLHASLIRRVLCGGR